MTETVSRKVCAVGRFAVFIEWLSNHGGVWCKVIKGRHGVYYR